MNEKNQKPSILKRTEWRQKAYKALHNVLVDRVCGRVAINKAEGGKLQLKYMWKDEAVKRSQSILKKGGGLSPVGITEETEKRG